ncbi:hypothetical protein J2787_000849 [Chryseobacterium rhizosphaerae]|uniref:Uncharacterized protein n=1 Tax=Chryseobacterium rhizosphaerae TaxID=395937 RepID=A0AAE3Y7S7_9FLAO|nr:hypothetical protein [Chryseobacterium rhizosphaerae]
MIIRIGDEYLHLKLYAGNLIPYLNRKIGFN